MKYIEVKKSKIDGNGLFVNRNVKRGQFVSFLKGKVCKKENQSKEDSLDNPCWVGVGKNEWLDPAYPFKFINHSCNPSVGIRGRVTLVALRDMKPGDEITFDYSITEIDPNWYMNCKCGEKNCRKKIRSIQYLPKKILKRYFPFIPTYFRRSILDLP